MARGGATLIEPRNATGARDSIPARLELRSLKKDDIGLLSTAFSHLWK